MKGVETKLKKGNQILFNKESEELQELLELMNKQNRLTMVLWAFDCVQKPISILNEKLPETTLFDEALSICKDWAQGKNTMDVARKTILKVHAMAKETDDKEIKALIHAVGQALSTVHVATHAKGLCFYELTAIVRSFGNRQYEEAVHLRIAEYIDTLIYWQKHAGSLEVQWSDFLRK